jgi:hypothetical protein
MKPLIIASAILTATSISALAQTPADRSLSEQITGTWVSTSVGELYEDGHIVKSWDPDVKAAVIFDGKGHLMITIIGGSLISPPPPNQNPPVAKRPVVASFGTYTVDEAASTVTTTYERSSEPNLEKVARTQSMKLNGSGELEQTSAPIKGPQGTFRPIFGWKRAQ